MCTSFYQKRQYLLLIRFQVLSLRSALVSTSCALLADLAIHLTHQLDPFVERILIILLKLTSQSKRMLVTLGSSTGTTVLRNTSFQTRVMERILEVTNDKNPTAREKAIEFLKVTLEECWRKDASKALFVRASGQDSLEKMLMRTLGDANSNVREKSRDIFGMYQQQWPDRSEK